MTGPRQRLAAIAQREYEDSLTPDGTVAHAEFLGDRIAHAIREEIEQAVAAERQRIKDLLIRPFLHAMRCIPDGEIRDGCNVFDGHTVREKARQAYLAIDGEAAP